MFAHVDRMTNKSVVIVIKVNEITKPRLLVVQRFICEAQGKSTTLSFLTAVVPFCQEWLQGCKFSMVFCHLFLFLP